MLDLLNIPENAVIGFISDEEKVAHITFSRDAIIYLAAATKSLKQGCFKDKVIQGLFNRKLIKICVLEEASTENLKYRCHYYVDKYSNMGYNMVSIPKFRCTVKKEYDRHEVRVCIVNTKYEKIVVGTFATDDAASDFISTYYKENVYNLVYKEPAILGRE